MNDTARHSAIATARITCIVFILITLLFAGITGHSTAQTTAVPTLPINVFQSTPTADVSQATADLGALGLQASELPGSGLFTLANPQNGRYTLAEQGTLWSEQYPGNPQAQSLTIAYANNGVTATALSEFSAPDCAGLSISALGSWLRLTGDEFSAQGLVVDITVLNLYQQLFAWEVVTDSQLARPGESNLFRIFETGPACRQARYIYEYPYGRYVVAVIVATPEGTDRGVAETTLQSLAGIINARIDAAEGVPVSASTAAPTISTTPTVARNVVVTLPPVIGSAEAYLLQSDPIGIEPFNQTGGVTNPTVLVRNPAYANRYVMTDALGLLFTMENANPARMNVSPFLDFIPPTLAENNDIVTDAAWSPDGQHIAFVINTEGNPARSPDDGVWYFTPNQIWPLQMLISCPPGCEIVTRAGEPQTYSARSVVWSPGSDWILMGVHLFEEDRGGLIALPRTTNETVRHNRPNVFYYDYGDWAPDGRLVVSGRSPEGGPVVLGWLDRDGDNLQIMLNGTSQGLWLQNGTQRPDDDKPYSGELLALGRPGDPVGPLWMYRQDGTQITQIPIGVSSPAYVRWNQDRSAVYVVTSDSRHFVAEIDGTITEITQQVSDIDAVGWEYGWQPPTEAIP